MPVSLKTNMNDLYKVCFEKTIAIPSNQFGFVIFDNNSMQVVVSKNTVPEIEVFVGKHMKNADLPWITKEIQTVRLMFFFENASSLIIKI